jgi:hypothetical protein
MEREFVRLLRLGARCEVRRRTDDIWRKSAPMRTAIMSLATWSPSRTQRFRQQPIFNAELERTGREFFDRRHDPIVVTGSLDVNGHLAAWREANLPGREVGTLFEPAQSELSP